MSNSEKPMEEVTPEEVNELCNDINTHLDDEGYTTKQKLLILGSLMLGIMEENTNNTLVLGSSCGQLTLTSKQNTPRQLH